MILNDKYRKRARAFANKCVGLDIESNDNEERINLLSLLIRTVDRAVEQFSYARVRIYAHCSH